MQKFLLVSGTFVALLVLVTPLAAAERMKAGQWELTVTEGGRSHTNTDCITPEKVKAVNGTPEELRADIETRAAAMNCTIQDFKMQGDTVSYTTACKTFSMDNTINYHGDTMETEMKMKKPGGAARKVNARFLGACP